MRFVSLSLLLMTSAASLAPAQAADTGYSLTPTLAHAEVSEDPDGIWRSSDLTLFGKPPHLPSIYVATLATVQGEWILSTVDNQCSPQSDCQAVLVFRSKAGGQKVVANPSLVMGGTARLSADFKTITTEEVDDSANAFTGRYDVGAP